MKSGKNKVVKQEIQRIQVDSGKGVPQSILDKLAAVANKSRASRTFRPIISRLDNLLNEPVDDVESSTTKQALFADVSMRLNLDEYEFPEEETIDPLKSDVQLDVTALDRYNEDIRKHRRDLLDECRLLPHTGDVDRGLLERIRRATFSLCRTVYYGTYKAQKLSEGSVLLVIWLLNRRNLPFLFHVKMLQCLSEMLWASQTLKLAFVRNHGVPVTIRLMKSGMMHHTNLACWSAYALLAGTIGCGETIRETQLTDQIDEFIGEMTFDQYWRDWPANFGQILQGVIFGPHSVSPNEDEFIFK